MITIITIIIIYKQSGLLYVYMVVTAPTHFQLEKYSSLGKFICQVSSLNEVVKLLMLETEAQTKHSLFLQLRYIINLTA